MKNILKHKYIIAFVMLTFLLITGILNWHPAFAKGNGGGSDPADTETYTGSDGNGGYYVSGHHYTNVKYTTKTVIDQLQEDRWKDVYSYTDTNWKSIKNGQNRTMTVEKGWADPDEFVKIDDNTLEIRTIKHPIIRAFITYTSVNSNYCNSYKTLRFDWKSSGPAAVGVQGKSGKITSWTTPANSNTSVVEYFQPGTYTITSIPYENWNINYKYTFSAKMVQAGTELGNRTYYVTQYSKKGSGEIVSGKKHGQSLLQQQI